MTTPTSAEIVCLDTVRALVDASEQLLAVCRAAELPPYFRARVEEIALSIDTALQYLVAARSR